jgi:rod shape determining protein RodA
MVSIASARVSRARSARMQVAQYDPYLLILVVVLTVFGLVTIWSADGGGIVTLGSPVARQAVYAAGGLLAMAILTNLDYRYLKSFAVVIYLGTVLLLASLLVIGVNIGGSVRWIQFGPISFQPSEIAKVGVIIALAAFISERQEDMDRITNFLLTIGIVAVPMALVYEQPDLGTTVVFMAIWFGMIAMSSTRTFYIIATVLAAVPFSYAAWHFMLQPYQKDRLLVSYDPNRDYFGQGFNIIQAQVTIGSAGWFGHGLTGGSQSEFQLLRVRTTDFIFAHAMSMFGFVGGLALFLAFALLIWRMSRVVSVARDTFGQQLAVGILSMVFFQTFVNIGMNLGMMPVTGIPLPFISLGGTSLFTLLASIGILQSVVLNNRRLGFQAQ